MTGSQGCCRYLCFFNVYRYSLMCRGGPSYHFLSEIVAYSLINEGPFFERETLNLYWTTTTKTRQELFKCAWGWEWKCEKVTETWVIMARPSLRKVSCSRCLAYYYNFMLVCMGSGFWFLKYYYLHYYYRYYYDRQKVCRPYKSRKMPVCKMETLGFNFFTRLLPSCSVLV